MQCCYTCGSEGEGGRVEDWRRSAGDGEEATCQSKNHKALETKL